MYACLHGNGQDAEVFLCVRVSIERVSEYALIFFPLQWRVWVQLITMTWL